MERIKPSHYDVYPVYTCHKCDAEHQQTLEETVFPAGILCYCGEKLKIATIEKVDVKPHYKNKGVVTPAEDLKEVKKDEFYDGTQTSDELFEEILAGSI